MKNRNGIKIGGMEMKAEKYAGQVTKYLKCSGGRKKEIKKQITYFQHTQNIHYYSKGDEKGHNEQILDHSKTEEQQGKLHLL